MNNTFEVKKTLTINAGTAKVWDAITNPDKIKIYYCSKSQHCDTYDTNNQ